MAHGLMPELTQGCESPALHPGPRHGQEGWRQAGMETAPAQPSADPSPGFLSLPSSRVE